MYPIIYRPPSTALYILFCGSKRAASTILGLYGGEYPQEPKARTPTEQRIHEMVNRMYRKRTCPEFGNTRIYLSNDTARHFLKKSKIYRPLVDPTLF